MDSEMVTKPWFVQQVRKALQDLNLPAQLYVGHSFRIGAAMSAALSGVEDSWPIYVDVYYIILCSNPLFSWVSDCIISYDKGEWQGLAQAAGEGVVSCVTTGMLTLT